MDGDSDTASLSNVLTDQVDLAGNVI